MLAESTLLEINPPLHISSSDELESLLADKNNITLCMLSTFHFVKDAITQIVQQNVQGNILLAGVWHGGLAAYIQALLVDHKATDRVLYLADTFCGFVNITDEHPRDKEALEYFSRLNIPPGNAVDVQKTFQKFGLPMDNIVFLEGDVKITTSDLNEKLAMLLIDLDFYSPTRDCLNNVYKNVSNNGFVYVDDYLVTQFECREAVDEFIDENALKVSINTINSVAVYWIKE